MDILARIKYFMEKKDLSQAALAKLTDVPQSTINSMFKRNRQPTVFTLQQICKGLDISVSEFFADGKTSEYLTAEQRRMVDKWSELTPEQQDALLRLIESM